jgi:16S rRNA processing protein RimM
MEYICIGKIVNTFGIRGELKIKSYSDFDELRYKKGNTVYLLKDGKYLPFITASFRSHKGFSLVSFKDMQDINLVEQYKECEIYIDKESRKPLQEGEYYRSDLQGLKAADENGTVIGTVTDVEETLGANNFLRIEKEDGSEALIPYVPAFVREVKLDEKMIVIHVVEGLL